MSVEAKSRLAEVKERVSPYLKEDLAKNGFSLGDSSYIRIFKHEREFELWIKPKSSERYEKYATYKVAGMSGVLGPKEREGDFQAPEGFYGVKKSSLNPKSSYHLSFNVGYPNSFDRFHKRTGSFIMVHGSNQSVGCFAMTDPVIEVIYLIVEASLNGGQKEVPVHVFPARYEKARRLLERSEWSSFWKDLKVGYDFFNKEKRPPSMAVEGGKYVLRP